MLSAGRIALGPVLPADFSQLFAWANDVASARLDLAYRPVDMATHLQWCQSIGNDPGRVVFAIRKVNEPAIIGYVQISAIHAVHRSAELGIRIGEERDRGQGLGQDALRLALAYCWDHLNLNRVQLIVFRTNARAIGAYRAAGFRKEGHLRKAAFIDGAWTDLVVMGALRPARKAARRAPAATAGTPPSHRERDDLRPQLVR